MNKSLRNEQGFTLIELMVVVLIIGILVAIAIPVFQSTQNNAKRRACFANLRTMNGGMEQYNAEAVEFAPGTTIANLSALTGSTVVNSIAYGPWLKKYPRCPGGGTYAIDGGEPSCSSHGKV